MIRKFSTVDPKAYIEFLKQREEMSDVHNQKVDMDKVDKDKKDKAAELLEKLVSVLGD